MTQLALRKVFIIGYIVFCIGLFLYSFTQVDLNLTLSRVGFLQTIQKSFQSIGYFQRIISSVIFITIISGFYVLYGLSLKQISNGKFTLKEFKVILVIICGILVFSYPAFSYDIFNYLFSAKTAVVYHKNPFIMKPLDFVGLDPWLLFMRWTHVPSAYTPLWIGLTIPVYIMGFNYFLPTLLIFKLLFASLYLCTVWLIWKTLGVVDSKRALLGTAIFALNPLVIIESIVSPHNDIFMAALAVLAFYLYTQKNSLLSYLVLASSVAAKMMMIFLYPAAIFGWNRKHLLFWATIAGLVASGAREPQPWYFIWVMPFVSLYPLNWKVIWIYSSVTFGLLLRYMPYLFYGEYTPQVNVLRNIILVVPLTCVCVYYLAKFAPKRQQQI